MQHTTILKNIPIFSCLDEEELFELNSVATKRIFPKNSLLINEGDKTDSLYIIASGKVKAIITDENGKEVILSIFGPGEYFGELAFIDGEHRSASIITRETTEVLIISREGIRDILSSNPNLAFNLLVGVVKRLREATKQIESLALMDVYGRVARLLVHLAVPHGNKHRIEDKLTHQEIANMTGSSREMVTRIFKDLIYGGYISVKNKQITINKQLPYSW
ncbi:MAG: Crp/Fnr family transcriptional regulator [Proteobacteria bacterium]|nr:Crp/Fnr family transcriptional regulator [Pseudomonadota bacterium]MBU4010680.1 Crp/Fnr family transcriptional regulator [Pseudomonadota bacterium]